MFPKHPLDADRVDDFWTAISTNDGQLLWPEQLVKFSVNGAIHFHCMDWRRLGEMLSVAS